MYELIIKEKELLDEESYEFIHTKRYKIVIEHSLVSISKWEAFYEESFFEVKAISDMDRNKFLKYVKFMTITQNIDDAVYTYLDEDELGQIIGYMNSKQTATVINKLEKNTNEDTFITSELVYYWMVALRIPSDYQKWHINRLLTLITICNIKQNPPEKSNESDILSRYERMNQERIANFKNRGLKI